MTEIVIPYKPRYPQTEIHEVLDRTRFVVLVAHRRMGKTVLAVNHLLRKAIVEAKPGAHYAYIAPFRNQAKSIAWGYLQHFAACIPGLLVSMQDLSITLPTGAMIRLYGADNPDALRGAYFDGVVIDEVAQIKPSLWGEVIRPALADRGGWAVFIGTPKGINLFSELYERALAAERLGESDWRALLYSIEQTKVIDGKELESLRRDMSENEFRQEFLCDFSAASDDTLISIDVIREAAGRHYAERDYMHAPVVLGVDVARFGNDASVIVRRQGLVAFEPIVIRHADTIALANRIAAEVQKHQPAAVFVDLGGGQGVVDYLNSVGVRVVGVHFGGGAADPDQHANRRMEMWWELKKWLEGGGAIPPHTALQADLATPHYGFTPRGAKILESKDKIKERLGRSTDVADALALTFASPVRPQVQARAASLYGRSGSGRYDPDKAFDKLFRS